ncbi:MAG: type VI secretion system tube protein Hcp [Planctomycetes bacterium]|nr:type VI secretion system tube protein Hcp [Planctomycetota bacterium]
MAVDMFLKLEGIKGESKDHKHGAEIHIESFSWGMNQAGVHGTGGGGAGKVHVFDMSVTKYVDKSTPSLLIHCAAGKHIANGLLTFRKAGDKPLEYLKIKLADILITGVQETGGHRGGDLMTENVGMNFAKFWVEYQEQDEKGAGKPGGEMGWDIKANEKL